MTFTQNFTSLAYNVTAVPQNDSYDYGPAYLLNGLSNDYYWYQVGLSYDWPYQSGGYSSGFNFNYEVFNSSGDSIYPTNGGGGLESFSGPVNSGDLVALELYFTNGTVYMYAQDLNTEAFSQVTFSDNQTTEFIGLSSSWVNSNGFFTGLMTEWYHVNLYNGDEYPVTYSDNTFGLSSAWIWMDEWQPPNGSTQYIDGTQVAYLSNPTQLQYFSYKGANEFSSAYEFITGSIGTQLTSITLLSAGGSTPLSTTNEFAVSYTLGGQPQVGFAQGDTLTLFADNGTNMAISGVSTDSLSTGSQEYGNLSIEEWVLNSHGTNVTVLAGSTTTFYYYDILSQQVAYAIRDETGTPISPILTYYTAPQTSSSQSNTTDTTIFLPELFQQTIMVLRGTPVSVSNNILGTTQDQWATPISSWNISQANQIPSLIIYYHQYQVTAGYSASDNSVPSIAPLLSGTQFGSNYQLPLSTTNQTTWLDENTPWSISTTVTAPSGTEQWVSSTGTSGTITQAVIINPTYLHQYYLTVNSPDGSPTGQGWYNAGNAVTFSASSPTSGGSGTQYVFAGWSGSGSYSGTSISKTVTLSNPITETASWTTQYYLNVSSSYSSTSGSGWYNSGASANFGISTSASGGTDIQYVFVSYNGSGSGAYSGTASSTSVTMNNPIIETAIWQQQYYLTVSSSYGTPSGSGWYNVDSTAYVSVNLGTVSGVSGTQYVFTSWSTGGSNYAQSSGIIMNAPITATALWIAQYYLTVNSAYGVPSGSGWYNSGITAYAGLNAGIVSGGIGTQYVFSFWSTGGTNYAQSNGITMNAPETTTALWITQYQIAFLVSGGGSTIPTGSNVWENAGSLSITTTPNGGYTFSSWSSDTASIIISDAHSATTTATINGPGTITGDFSASAATPIPTPTPIPTASAATPIPTPTPTPTPTASPALTVPEFPSQSLGITLVVFMMVVLSAVIIAKKRINWKTQTQLTLLRKAVCFYLPFYPASQFVTLYFSVACATKNRLPVKPVKESLVGFANSKWFGSLSNLAPNSCKLGSCGI
jgi:hypothetical protein